MPKLSPARAWAAKKRAEADQLAARQAIETANAAEVTAITTTPSGFEALRMTMEQDVVSLHGMPVEEKAAFKAARLPGYLEHVAEYEKLGEVYANPILVETMIWSADLLLDGHQAASAPLFERLAMLCIEQGQKLPERFNTRNLPTFVADAVRAWAETKYDTNTSAEPLFSRVMEKLSVWPVPQAVRMKFEKLAGHIAFDQSDWLTAYVHYCKAELLQTGKDKASVKTKKTKAKEALEKQGVALPSVTLETSVNPITGTDETGTEESATESAATDGQPEHPADDAATTENSSDASQ